VSASIIRVAAPWTNTGRLDIIRPSGRYTNRIVISFVKSLGGHNLDIFSNILGFGGTIVGLTGVLRCESRDTAKLRARIALEL